MFALVSIFTVLPLLALSWLMELFGLDTTDLPSIETPRLLLAS